MKKTLCVLLALTILFSVVPLYAAAVSVSDFTDLPNETSWAYEGIAYCIDNGYMNGIDAATFSPKSNVTRGQLVTMLYRIEGEPEVEFKGTFDDVDESAYYALAVEWAFANGIVFGIDLNRFGPKEDITRQQIAAIIHRYCGSPLPAASIDDFPDANDCQLYSILPMSWCVENGLINGVAEDGLSYLKPRDNATREQIAAIVMRLIKNVLGESESPDESDTPAEPVTPSEPETPSVPESGTNYLDAYAEILHAELENSVTFARFCLTHIDGDSIPELIISPAWVTTSVPTVYTYYNGEAVEIGSFGSMGGFEFAYQKNIIHSAFLSIGYSTNSFSMIADGTYETIAYFENNQYAFSNEEKYFKFNDAEVTENEYNEQLNQYLNSYEWTEVDYYETCEAVTEANIELMLSEPETFILVP